MVAKFPIFILISILTWTLLLACLTTQPQTPSEANVCSTRNLDKHHENPHDLHDQAHQDNDVHFHNSGLHDHQRCRNSDASEQGRQSASRSRCSGAVSFIMQCEVKKSQQQKQRTGVKIYGQEGCSVYAKMLASTWPAWLGGDIVMRLCDSRLLAIGFNVLFYDHGPMICPFTLMQM